MAAGSRAAEVKVATSVTCRPVADVGGALLDE